MVKRRRISCGGCGEKVPQRRWRYKRRWYCCQECMNIMKENDKNSRTRKKETTKVSK